jgi:hypothetical protein
MPPKPRGYCASISWDYGSVVFSPTGSMSFKSGGMRPTVEAQPVWQSPGEYDELTLWTTHPDDLRRPPFHLYPWEGETKLRSCATRKEAVADGWARLRAEKAREGR